MGFSSIAGLPALCFAGERELRGIPREQESPGPSHQPGQHMVPGWLLHSLSLSPAKVPVTALAHLTSMSLQTAL